MFERLKTPQGEENPFSGYLYAYSVIHNAISKKNFMKKLLRTSLISLFSTVTFAQSLDISNGSFRIEDSLVIGSDTLEYDMTGIMVYDIHNSDKNVLLDILANALDMGLTKGPDNLMIDPKTFVDCIYVDYRFSVYRKKIVKEIKYKLQDKVVIYYYFNENDEREDLYLIEI